MLCHGYQRVRHPQQAGEDHDACAGIPGVVSHYPNSNVETLKGASWANVLRLLGKRGEEYMLDMILDCGTFVSIDEGSSNYFQLSGAQFE